MANLIGSYKLKAKPTLPTAPITQNLDFVVSFQGESVPFTSIRIDSTGISYLIKDEGGDGASSGEAQSIIKAGTYRFHDELTAPSWLNGSRDFSINYTTPALYDFPEDNGLSLIPSDGTSSYNTLRLTYYAETGFSIGEYELTTNGGVINGNTCYDRYSRWNYTSDIYESANYSNYELAKGFGQTVTVPVDTAADPDLATWFEDSTDPVGDVSEPEYVLVYSAEEGRWMYSELRKFLVEKEQSVSDAFDQWLASNLWVKPVAAETIKFTVNGETFTAPKDTSWFVWGNGSSASTSFTATPDDLVAYRQCVISYGGEPVNMYELIIAGANYTIMPQIVVYIRVPTGVKMNPLFTKRHAYGWTLHANTTYTIDLVCPSNHYAIPRSAVWLNDYVRYDLTPDKLTISVGDIPANFIGQEPLEIEVETARKMYDKLIELTTVTESEKGKIVELAPQYKVNIDGSYYLEGSGTNVSATASGYAGLPIYGIVSDLNMLRLGLEFISGASGSGSVLPITAFLAFVGVDPTSLVVGNRLYAMDSWFIEYMNQELLPEDIVGQPIMVMEYDVDKIMDYYIATYAKKNNVSVEEYIAIIEAEAGAPEGSDAYNAFVLSYIQQQEGIDITWLRYLTDTTVDEEMAAAINLVLKNYKTNLFTTVVSLSSVSAGATIWYAMGANNKPVKNIFTYKPGRNALYPLYNGKTQIQDDFVVSDTIDFNITSTGEKLNNYNYLRVDKYIPPTDRYTPGTVSISVQSCLAGDTLIEMADGSFKRLDQIHVGDEVKTPSGIERVIFSDAYANKQKNKYTDYCFNDGTTLRVIKDHRVYSPKHRKFVHISTLKIGDKIVKNDGTKSALVERITVTGESIAHYTLFTENLNGYFANGILCGNVFSNIGIGWMRNTLLKLYHKFVLRKELQYYGQY